MPVFPHPRFLPGVPVDHVLDLLPPFPQLETGWPPELVEVEYCARFPWSGGRHPWLDAFVETAGCIIGVEFEAF